jgi:uncharacterized membrane protein YhaH (DUF805 family)
LGRRAGRLPLGDFMDWMLMPLRRYADFSGRSQRIEYWMFVLFVLLVLFAGVIMGGVAGAFESSGKEEMPVAAVGIFGLLGLFYLAMFIPMLAVQVRRFHDQDKSGWMVLLGFVPYVGGLIMLVFMCIEGTPGPNRFGADPKDPYNAEIFS